jgi:glycosyltransferase involved in cell wall biosynthesis
LSDAIFPKKTQKKWVEYLNQQDYDIIITTASLSLRLAMIAPQVKAKTIGWQHNCFSGYLDVPYVVFWKQECLLQEYLPKLDRYIVLSDYDKRDYKEILGIDTEVKINPRSFVSEQKCDVNAKRFLMATRFVYAKGLDLMMESFEEFCKSDDEWQLDIIGDGELKKEIIADAKRRGIIDRVNFVGYTNEAEKYYLQSSVFLLPSRWEGWPMVIMEAYEFGLPVIAYHMGAMDLIIEDGKTGLLPKAFDTHKFAEAMLELAHNDDLRKQMYHNAIEKSAEFDIEKTVAEWNKLFQRLIQG